MKILICGLPGAGKTWLAERLIKVIDNCAWYNADVVRKSANDWDFTMAVSYTHLTLPTITGV